MRRTQHRAATDARFPLFACSSANTRTSLHVAVVLHAGHPDPGGDTAVPFTIEPRFPPINYSPQSEGPTFPLPSLVPPVPSFLTSFPPPPLITHKRTSSTPLLAFLPCASSIPLIIASTMCQGSVPEYFAFKDSPPDLPPRWLESRFLTPAAEQSDQTLRAEYAVSKTAPCPIIDAHVHGKCAVGCMIFCLAVMHVLTHLSVFIRSP